MIEYKKKNKIIDCFLFYDEIEMLKYRLAKLYDKVDFFVILESDIDFQNNSKELFFQKNSIFFKEWEPKIIYLKLTGLKFESSHNVKEQILKFSEMLFELFIQIELSFEDTIMFSDVDEIPDLDNFDYVEKFLIYEPMCFLQKNFIWNKNYLNLQPHMGTICFTYSQFESEKTLIDKIYFFKTEVFSPYYKIFENGYHFSHFYPEHRFLNKIKILKNKEVTIDSLENFKKTLLRNEDFDYIVVNNSTENLQDELLPHYEIFLREPKKNLVVLNFNMNKISEIVGYDYVLNINFLKIYNFEDEEIVDDIITNYNIFIPQSNLYESEKFELEFGINEIKKIISKRFPLDSDIFDFVIYDESLRENEKKRFSWSKIKDNFIYELLKNPSN